jgi:hypothetical protein
MNLAVHGLEGNERFRALVANSLHICPAEWAGKRNTPRTKGACCKHLRISQDVFDTTFNIAEQQRLVSFADDNHGPQTRPLLLGASSIAWRQVGGKAQH